MPHSERMTLKLGETLHHPGESVRHFYSPVKSIGSLLERPSPTRARYINILNYPAPEGRARGCYGLSAQTLRARISTRQKWR